MNRLRDKCIAMHSGPWMVAVDMFSVMVSQVNTGVRIAMSPEATTTYHEANATPQRVGRSAVVGITGPMMKGDSKYGGTNTLRTRNALRSLAGDPDVDSIMLSIDSPGGTVAGTEQLAADVREVNSVKPVHALIHDMGASAAYFVASQADKIWAEPSSMIGSIGTMTVLEDSSAAAEQDGVKVHVIASGANKAIGTPGTEITDDQLQHVRKMVEDANGFFLDAVSSGRGLTGDALQNVADGRLMGTDEAMQMGLIDGIGNYDRVITELRTAVETPRTKVATARVALASRQHRR